ncbi:MAG: MarP family serine protease [Actinomycetes bacterium]
MDLLDILLLVAVLVFAVAGYRQGFIVSALSFIGFVGGGALAMVVTPHLLRSWPPGVKTAAVSVGIVFGAALLGQLLAGILGHAIRRVVRFTPLRFLDSAFGAVVNAAAMLLVVWLVATAARFSPLTVVSQQIRGSQVLATVDRYVPSQVDGWFTSFRLLLDRNGFSRVFSGIGPEPVVPVAPPDPSVVGDPATVAAAASIVKIVGDAPSCSRQIEGSGFVFAPGHVMTNAHVVAGVRNPVVRVGGTGPSYPARVVLFDAERDVAVLYVPGLTAPALRLDQTLATRGTSAVVAGFPENGPFRVVAARVRSVLEAKGPDIYGQPGVVRQVYSLYTSIAPGNSGGPMLSTSGQVLGVVFAESVDSPSTGYALTANEVAPLARSGATASTPVGTGACALP